MSPSPRDQAIRRLAIPALGGLAVEPLYVLVDTAIVGHLGTSYLGGLALASAVLVTSFQVFNFLAYGITARVAYLSGGGDERAAAGVAAQGLWMSLLLGGLLVGLIAGAGRLVAQALGGSGAVLDAATTYLRISAIGVPFVLVALVGHGYLRGVQDTRTPLVVVLCANGANVVLEILFVYRLHMGMAGSAWGTVIAQAGAAAWFLVLIARRIAATGSGLRLEPEELRRLARTGRHMLVRTGALLLTLALATAVAARLGPATLGGHQIALQIETLLALSVDALAIAAQAMVGTFLGASDRAEARATARRLVQMGLMVGMGLAAVVVLTSPWLPHLFSGDAAVTDRARLGLVMVGLLQIPASAVFVLDGVLMGASDFRYLQWGTVAGLVAFLPAAAGVLHFHLGIVGLWGALVIWMLARLAANTLRYRTVPAPTGLS